MERGTKIKVIEPAYKKMYGKVLQVWESHTIHNEGVILTWFKGNPYVLYSSDVEIVKEK